jgi:hypothetical protein
MLLKPHTCAVWKQWRAPLFDHFTSTTEPPITHRRCGSEAHEILSLTRKVIRVDPRSFRVPVELSRLSAVKSGCRPPRWTLAWRGVVKICIGNYLLTLCVGTPRRGPAMDAGAHPPGCRQWLVFYLFLCLREAAGETLDHYLVLPAHLLTSFWL